MDLFLRKGGVTAKTMGSFLSNTTTKPTAALSVFWFYLLCHHHSLGTSHISLSPSFRCNKYSPAKSEWGTKILQGIKEVALQNLISWWYFSASIFQFLVLWAVIFTCFCSEPQFTYCFWVCFPFLFLSPINYALEFQCSNILENPKVGWILFLKSWKC